MTTNLTQLTPLPTPGEPLFDLKTGKINSNWYQYFKRLDEHLRDIERRLAVGSL